MTHILSCIFLFVKLEENSLCKILNLDTSMQIKAANLGYIQYFVEPIKDERRQLLFHARPNLKGLMERERCFFLLFNEFDDDESLSVEEVLLSSQSSFALIGGRVFLKENKCATKVHVLNEKPVLLRPPPFSLPETPSPSPMLPCPASSDDKNYHQ